MRIKNQTGNEIDISEVCHPSCVSVLLFKIPKEGYILRDLQTLNCLRKLVDGDGGLQMFILEN